MVDIHAHILPGIDDGPESVEASLEMGHAAASAGITTLVATPHVRADFPAVDVHELSYRLAALQQEVDRIGIDLRLVAGGEVALAWALEATDEELRLASIGQGGKDLLIETPHANTFGLDRILDEVRVRGYRIVLAHPERSPELRSGRDRLTALSAQGILLQVNAASLVGGRGDSSIQKTARWLCSEGKAHVVASDGHRGHGIRPVGQLQRAAEVLAGLAGTDRAHWMTQGVPAAIVAGDALPPKPELRARRGFFGRLGSG